MPVDLVTETTAILERTWAEVLRLAEQGQLQDWLDDGGLVESINRAIKNDVQALIDHEFVSGHNIYITTLSALAREVLQLLGEQGRREFVAEVGKQLEQYRSDVHHRRVWADLLGTI
jgi:hypothetical protein